MLWRRANTDLSLCHACSPSSLMKIERGQRIRRENPEFWTLMFCPRRHLIVLLWLWDVAWSILEILSTDCEVLCCLLLDGQCWVIPTMVLCGQHLSRDCYLLNFKLILFGLSRKLGEDKWMNVVHQKEELKGFPYTRVPADFHQTNMGLVCISQMMEITVSSPSSRREHLLPTDSHCKYISSY